MPQTSLAGRKEQRSAFRSKQRGDGDRQCRKRAGREKGTASAFRTEEGGGRQCRRRAGKGKTASGGRALRNAGEKAIKTEICLSAASLFPFSRIAGVSARSDAALIFLFANFIFSSRKRKSGPQTLGERKRKSGPPNLGRKEKKWPPQPLGKRRVVILQYEKTKH